MNILHIVVYFIIMIGTGILGGIINYFLQPIEETEKIKRPSLIIRSITIGIGASFVVPLFLEIIQSDLIRNDKLDNSKIFVFMGFCLIASIYSRKFLSTLSDKVIKDIKVAKEKAIEVEKRLEDNEVQLSADSQILALLEHLFVVDPESDDSSISESRLRDNIIKSSEYTKAVAFARARSFRLRNFKKKTNLERLIPVFEALIECDSEEVYHRNHAELAYVLKDKKNPNFVRALKELDTAIMIRDRRGLDDYSAYEFNRALCRIHLDEKFQKKRPSTKEKRDEIINDLKIAAKNRYWKSILKSKKLKDGTTALSDWLNLNKIEMTSFD